MLLKADVEPIIRKLSACAKWRETERGVKAILGEALAAAASNEYHAEQIIAKWIQHNRFLPTPADIHALAPDVPARRQAAINTGACSTCRGTGRESYWALQTTERWEDSGRVKHRRLERIPVDRWVNAEAQANHVDATKLALMRSPRIEGGSQDGQYWEAVVDGIAQVVAIVNGFCACEFGQHLAQLRIAGQEQDASKNRR